MIATESDLRAPARPGPDLQRWSVVAAGMMLVAIGLVHSGCASQPKKRDFDVVVARFYIETAPQDPRAEIATLPRSSVQVPILPQPVLSEADYTNVELVRVDLGLCLLFEIPADGARKLYALTGSNLGRRLVIKLNGQPFGARIIEAPIADGRLYFFVELPDEELTLESVNLRRTSREVIQPALQKGRKK